MLTKRLISAVLGIFLVIFFIMWGSLPFLFFTCIITTLALWEYANLLSDDFENNRLILIFLGLFIVIFVYVNNIKVLDIPLGLIFIFVFLFLFIYHIAFYSYNDIINKVGSNILGLFYIGGGMSILPLLRDLDVTNFFVAGPLCLALIATWATDTGAFFTGKYFGKHPLTSEISPNKTIEGAIGGIVFNLIAVTIYVSILNIFSFSWIIYGILSAVIAIIGDLFESSLKRDVSVKDTGSLIPGHGGILDRFDSLIFSSAFTYYFFILIL